MGAMTAPSKPPAIVLPPRLGGVTTFRQVARQCLDHADANEPFLDVNGDHEGLHQFRVGYRRLRSLFSLARPVSRIDPEADRLRGRLRDLTVTLGPARDLDVFREAHPTLIERDARHLEAARVTAYGQMHTFLTSDEWLQSRADLERWLARGEYAGVFGTRAWSGRGWTAQALERRRNRIAKMGRALADLSDADRHKVRIEAKKVRYGCQFFGSLWPAQREDAQRLEKLLGNLQDRLGHLNDSVTWAGIVELAGLTDAEPPHVDVDAEIAAAQLIVDELVTVPAFWQRTLRR